MLKVRFPFYRLRIIALSCVFFSFAATAQETEIGPKAVIGLETVLRCDPVFETNAHRIVCEQRIVSSDIKVPLPDDASLAALTIKTEPDFVVPLPDDVSTLAIVIPSEPVELKPADNMPIGVMKAALKNLIAGKKLDRASLDEIGTFYKERDYAPLWLDKAGWSAGAKSIHSRLASAHADGLDPARYRSVTSIIETGRTEWPALAAAELELSASIVAYASDISIGRVEPQQVHALITPKRERPEAAFILTRLSKAIEPDKDIGQVLHHFAPPQEGYQRLRNRLEALRQQRDAKTIVVIPNGPVLRIGMSDRRIPLIRLKLGLHDGKGDIYDNVLALEVSKFQRSMKLLANSVITPQTVSALNRDPHSAEEADVITNMEFWRWLPRDLGKDHIFVNVPSYGLHLLHDGKIVHEARVIVGTEETQTPIFSDRMDHVVVNPSWFVPPSILKKDPRYLDPEWLKARGYTMTKRRNSVTVRVPPGATNALGNIKFMFPNDHAVYLHDTPNRRLFNVNQRILSNGCVRVENPFQLAARIFESAGINSAGISEDRFKRMVGGGEQRINLPQKLPIHLAYFTTEIDSSGSLVRHPDVYGHAKRLKQLLGLS
jgi:L,D-transpeptidase YcbB